MQIMKNDDMRTTLEKLRNSHIVIISAFVNGFFEVLENLLDNGNKVDIYTGTLNCFNSPYNMQSRSEIFRR